MKKILQNLKSYQMISIMLFLLFIVNTKLVLAEWEEPTCDPPKCNVAAPLNEGTTSQFKNSGLHIGTTNVLDDYMFSVQGGPSYFGDDLEVGDLLSIEANNRNIKLNKGNLNINSSKVTITNSNDLDGYALSVSRKKNTVIQGSSFSGNSVYGTSDSGIGIWGSTNTGLAGRFNGPVSFQPVASSADKKFAEINGGVASFKDKSNLLLFTTINPGYISVSNEPTADNQLANKKYVDDAISLGAGDDDWTIASNNGDIYRVSGKVGIGTNNPESKLDVRGLITTSCQNGTSSPPTTGLKIGDDSYIYDSSCSGSEPADNTEPFHTLHIQSPEVIDINSDNEIRLKVNNHYGIKLSNDGKVTLGGWLQSVHKNSYLQNGWNITGFYTGAAAVGKADLSDDEMEMALFGRTGNTISSEVSDATYGGVGLRAKKNGNTSYYGLYGYAKGDSSNYSYGVVGETHKGTAIRGISNGTGDLLVLDSLDFYPLWENHALVVDRHGNLDLGGDLTVNGDAFQVGGALDVAGDISGANISADMFKVNSAKIYSASQQGIVLIEGDGGPGGLEVNGILNVSDDATFDGNITNNGSIDMSNNKIVNLSDPTDDQDAATKAYVDSYTGGVGPDDDWVIDGDDIMHTNGNVGIGTVSPTSTLQVSSGNIHFQGNGGIPGMYWDNSITSLGIGTTSPQKLLDVAGDAVVRGEFNISSGALKINNINILHCKGNCPSN